jgi:MFS family permease
MVTKQANKNQFVAYAIFSIAAAFIFLGMGLQVSVSVMGNDLMHELNLTAASFGIIVSAFYLSYTVMQIPAGILFDRINARYLMAFNLMICAVGALLFGITQTELLAAVGRFLMGFGAAFSYISVLFVAAKWFDERHFALLVGLAQVFATIGAIGGKVPVAAAVVEFGWRGTLFGLAGLGALLSILAWFIVRNPPQEKPLESPNKRTILQDLAKLITNRQTWIIGLHAFSVWAPMIVFAGANDVLFLTTAYEHISRTMAATAGAVIWLGSGLGSMILCWWSDAIGKRRLPLFVGAFLGLIATLIIFYVPSLPLTVMFCLLFILGMASAGQALSFAVVKDNNTSDVTGTAIGFNNMAVVAGGFLLPPLVGKLLDSHASLSSVIHTYSLSDYRYALTVLPICYVVALISLLWIKETNGQAN